MSAVTVESGKSTGGGGGGDSGGGQGDGMNDLYKINQIFYRMMPTLSLVSKRTLLVNQAQSPSYTGTNSAVIFNFNTGEFYISPTTSYLYIKCGFKAPAGTNPWGTTKALISQGNILSIFEEVIFTTASGTEVERQINKGLNHALTYRYGHTQEYIDTAGVIQGAPYGAYHRIHDGVAPVPTYTQGLNTAFSAGAMYPGLGGPDGISTPVSGSPAASQFGYAATNLNIYSTQTDLNGVPTPIAGSGFASLDYHSFVVPLDQVLGLFKPYQNCLFPAGALSGGRLEIRFKRAAEAFQFVGGMNEAPGASDAFANQLIKDADGAFTVASTYLVLDAFQLQDNVLKRLNQTAAGADGLSMLFDTYDTVTTPAVGTGQFEAQVTQARSRVVRSWCAIRDNSLITNPWVNSFATEAASRRVAGKVPAGSITSTAQVPVVSAPGGGANWGAVLAGGLIYPTLLSSEGGFLGDRTAVAYNFLITQQKLPDDPFGAAGTGDNGWGHAMVSSFQTQLGALFFPQQPFTNNKEHYENALYMFGRGVPDKDMTCSVTYEDFLGGLGYNLNGNGAGGMPLGSTGTTVDPTVSSPAAAAGNNRVRWVAPYGLAVYGALMEKSQALQLSGLPLSNARQLRHKITFPYLSLSGQRQISVFTQFTRVLKQFLGGRVVVRE